MSSENTLINKRIRIRITQDHHQEPVISRLVSEYGLGASQLCSKYKCLETSERIKGKIAKK
jgi:hypothetical protein